MAVLTRSTQHYFFLAFFLDLRFVAFFAAFFLAGFFFLDATGMSTTPFKFVRVKRLCRPPKREHYEGVAF